MIAKKNNFYIKFLKRLFDIVCSLLAMTVFCWLFLIVAVLVKIKLGSPVIYSAQRVGMNEKTFRLYKFRSMTNETDNDGNLLPDADRLTKFGRILRATSLDELPEAWNILKGDMSVIGPRPLPVQYLPYYTDAERHRHDVRPGLSGLAQVNGRNAIGWEEKFNYDLTYVNKVTFFIDLKIIFQTVFKVFKHEDIGLRGVDMPPDFDAYRHSKEGEKVGFKGTESYIESH